MIYIKIDTNSVQTISIPKYFEVDLKEVRLRLVNNLTNQIIDIEPRNFYIAEPYIQLEVVIKYPITEGEYSYSLIDNNDGVISFGIAVIGEYKREVKSYGESNKKIQYKR